MPSNTWTATNALSRAVSRVRAARRRRPRSAARSGTRPGGARGSPAPPRTASAARAARHRVLHLLEAHEPRAGEDAKRLRRPARAATRPRRRSRLRRGIVRGKRRATWLTTRKTWLSSSTSCSHSSRGRRGVGGASVRLLVRVSATGECGNVNSSKWSLPSTRSSSESSTSSSGSGRSTAWRRKDGTQRSVTAATTPSAPSADARGAQLVAAVDRALRPVGEHELDRLDARGEVAELHARPVRAGDERARERLGVDVAEVRAARGRARASSRDQRGAGRCPPRRARARSPGRRRARGRGGRARAASRRSAPRPRTSGRRPRRAPRAPRATASASSARLPGRTCSAGTHVCPRDQFDHIPARLPPHELGARARGAAPARGARARDGRRGAGRAPARRGAADGARAHRAAVRPRHVPRDRRARRHRRRTTRTASSRPSPRRTWSVGQGEIDGRAAVVQGDDFTVRGGAADAAIWQKMVYAERMAHDLRLPLVRLVDGTGGGGLGQVARADGLHLRPVPPRAWSWRSPTSRACRWWPRRSARWPASARRAWSPRTSA